MHCDAWQVELPSLRRADEQAQAIGQEEGTLPAVQVQAQAARLLYYMAYAGPRMLDRRAVEACARAP